VWLHNANGEVTEYKGGRQSYGILMGLEIHKIGGGVYILQMATQSILECEIRHAIKG